MDTKTHVRARISSWVSSTFQSLGFESVTVHITGSSEKGDGYLGDIAFVEAICTNTEHSPKVFDLVVKCSKASKILREELPVELVFKREIFMYEVVVPIFRKLEEKHNLKILDRFLVKCFNTLHSNDEEAIILQNAKAMGYSLHDRFEPFNLNHLKLTFENYGRWHALGMAYRDQYREEFRRKFLTLENVLVKIYPPFRGLIDNVETTLYSLLEEQGQLQQLNSLKEILRGSMFDAVIKLSQAKEKNCAIIHGDCWNNNFMFKYSKEDKITPQDVLFLDFQLLGTGSPVFDLSYHLYATASDNELKEFNNLLRTYYDSFSFTLTQLGSKPEDVFTYDQLVSQWKQYSLYGFLLALSMIPMSLCEKQDAIDVQTMNNGGIKNMFDKLKETNNNGISSRILSITEHFLRNC